jgi:hypothetical protein
LCPILTRISAVPVIDTLLIEPDIEALIPPLTEEESRQLEANLLVGGCRDALEEAVGGSNHVRADTGGEFSGADIS